MRITKGKSPYYVLNIQFGVGRWVIDIWLNRLREMELRLEWEDCKAGGLYAVFKTLWLPIAHINFLQYNHEYARWLDGCLSPGAQPYDETR